MSDAECSRVEVWCKKTPYSSVRSDSDIGDWQAGASSLILELRWV